MSRGVKVLLFLMTAVGLYQLGVSATGLSIPTQRGAPLAPKTAADLAKDSYNSGIKHKDKGKQLEEQIDNQTFKDAKDRAKYDAKIQDEFGKALKDFQKAAELDPTLYQAFNGMGYAYRKTGDATQALAMYDKALQMAPGFPDALEYRGEAYLALARVDDAERTYLALLASDRTQADQLMKAMTAWVAKPPASVEPATLSAFEAWIQERVKLAATTADMGLRSNQSVWR
jgi:tetratricopeptide (TPR) repeat protein